MPAGGPANCSRICRYSAWKGFRFIGSPSATSLSVNNQRVQTIPFLSSKEKEVQNAGQPVVSRGPSKAFSADEYRLEFSAGE